jgi:hypothetical protein
VATWRVHREEAEYAPLFRPTPADTGTDQRGHLTARAGRYIARIGGQLRPQHYHHAPRDTGSMIDPSLVKTGGFIFALVGTVGSAAILFLPKRRAKWEKSIRIAFIVIALLGIISNRIGDYIISTANGPRNMSPAEWSALSDKMKAFAGEQFTIVSYTDENEARFLEHNIKACLDNAKWKYTEPTFGDRLIGGLQGVLIVINPSSGQNTREAAQALVNDLNEKWIWSRWSPEPTMATDKIFIHVFTRVRVY